MKKRIIYYKSLYLHLLTKTNDLKRFLFLLLSWYIFVQGSELFPEPIYYEIDFNDGVTHLWSRQVYYDYYGETTKQIQKAEKRFDGMDYEEINISATQISRTESSKKIKIIAGITKPKTIPIYEHKGY